MNKKFIYFLLLIFTCSMIGCASGNKNVTPENSEVNSISGTVSETEPESAIKSGGDQLTAYMYENYINPLFKGQILNTDGSIEEYSSERLLLFYFRNNLNSGPEYYASKDSVESYLSCFFDVDFVKLEQDASSASTLYSYSTENQIYDLTAFSDYDGVLSHGIAVEGVQYDEQSQKIVVLYSYISDFDNENELRTYKEATFRIEEGKLIFIYNKEVEG